MIAGLKGVDFIVVNTDARLGTGEASKAANWQ